MRKKGIKKRNDKKITFKRPTKNIFTSYPSNSIWMVGNNKEKQRIQLR